ncbi:hypothetical protein ACFVH6_30375 [Spirillospora sp. NPDC127200]
MMRPAETATATTRTTRELRKGDAIHVRGIGAVAVVGTLALPGGQMLILLARDDLAVVSTPDARWDALCLTAPLFTATVTFCSACRGVGRTCRL